MTIVEFLAARLDEEETELKARRKVGVPDPPESYRDLEAKRDILASEPLDRCDSHYTCHAWVEWDRVVRLLASVYADHADYDLTW